MRPRRVRTRGLPTTSSQVGTPYPSTVNLVRQSGVIIIHTKMGAICEETIPDDEAQATSRVTVLSLAQGLGVDFLPLATLLFLDGPDIARSGLTNRFLYRAACDEGVWRAARDRLWKGKVFIRESTRKLGAKAAYITSLMDSRRTWLEKDELTSFSWWFRFKQQAGEAWTGRDPWYRNEKAPTVEFKNDHSVHRNGDMSLPPAAHLSWRFVPRTGLKTGPLGSFLRLSIGGREVPTYIVSRHPTNWGFLLESCWTLYTSWEMPPRDGPGCDRSLLDDRLSVTMDDQWEEAMSFNTGLSFEIYDLAAMANEAQRNQNQNQDNALENMEGEDADGVEAAIFPDGVVINVEDTSEDDEL